MSIGGCYATVDEWRVFDGEWRKACLDEGLVKDGRPYFHMTDFEAWKPPFDFRLPDGKRDHEKHKRVLNTLLEIMLRRIGGYYGHGMVSDATSDDISHRKALDECAAGAVKHAVLHVSEYYGQPLNLVFAKQGHLPLRQFEAHAAVYDWAATKRIKTLATGEPSDILALQAADIWTYEVARAQRAGRPERYPYQRLVDSAKLNRVPMIVGWGPFRIR